MLCAQSKDTNACTVGRKSSKEGLDRDVTISGLPCFIYSTLKDQGSVQ